MAALPDTLVESELFDHHRGAFTGGVTSHDGKLVAANGGTVFLDAIGDVSLLAQVKLLRAFHGPNSPVMTSSVIASMANWPHTCFRIATSESISI